MKAIIKKGTKGWFETKLETGEDVATFEFDTSVEVENYSEHWYKIINIVPGFPTTIPILVSKEDVTIKENKDEMFDARCAGCSFLKDEGPYYRPEIVCTKEENEKCPRGLLKDESNTVNDLEAKLLNASLVVSQFKDEVTKIFNAETKEQFAGYKMLLSKSMTELEDILKSVEFEDLGK